MIIRNECNNTLLSECDISCTVFFAVVIFGINKLESELNEINKKVSFFFERTLTFFKTISTTRKKEIKTEEITFSV